MYDIILIGRLLSEEPKAESIHKEKSSLNNSRSAANKNWKKGLADLSVLIHILFKFSTRKVDRAYRLNGDG